MKKAEEISADSFMKEVSVRKKAMKEAMRE